MPANNNGFDAKRFAALMAGFDMGNSCEAEAMNAGRALRRMVAAAGLRIIDALEMAEVKRAIDDQMKPARKAAPDVTALQAENEDLRSKLDYVVPKLREVAEALKREKQLTVGVFASLNTAASIVIIAKSGVASWIDFVGIVVMTVVCAAIFRKGW